MPKKQQEWYSSEEIFDDINSAQEARHDYAHMGFYTRLIKLPATKRGRQKWELLLKNGPRLTYPRCCVAKKHWKVDDSKDTPTWIPREQAAKFKRKWMRVA